MTAHGWVHVLTSSLVCGDCLPDPWAEERGSNVVKLDEERAPTRYAGEGVAAQLRAAVGMANPASAAVPLHVLDDLTHMFGKLC